MGIHHLLRTALFCLLVFSSCKKEQVRQAVNLPLDPKVQQLKAQYEKTPEAQRLNLQPNWHAVKWQTQNAASHEYGDWTRVSIDEQLELLAIAPENGAFFYRKTLRAKESRLKDNVRVLLYDADGFLRAVVHRRPGFSDLYRIKETTGNSAEHHINSKAEKYNSWEAFDFEDFEWVDPQRLFDEAANAAATPVTRYNLQACLAASNTFTQGLTNLATLAASKPDEANQIFCNYYKQNIPTLGLVCPSYLTIVHIQNGERFCNAIPPKKIPCPGDPFIDMEVAPTTSGSIKGGKFGEEARLQWNKDRTELIPKPHDGIDLRQPVNSPFVAIYEGTVVTAGYIKKDPNNKKTRCYVDPQDGICKGDYGNYIDIKSKVNGKDVLIRYAHLNKMDVVKGQFVKQGDQLGLTGITGNASSDKDIIPHLHLGMQDMGTDKWIDPEPYLTSKFDAKGKKIAGTGDCTQKN